MIRKAFRFAWKCVFFVVVAACLFAWQGGHWHFATTTQFTTPAFTGLAFSFDGSFLFVNWSVQESTLELGAIDAGSGVEKFRIRESDPQSAVAYFCENRFVAVSCTDYRQIHLYELTRGKKLASFACPANMLGKIIDLHFLRDTRIFVQTDGKEFWSIDSSSGQWMRTLNLPEKAWQPCLVGRTIVAGSPDRKSLQAWDAETGAPVWTRDIHPSHISMIESWRCKDVFCTRLVHKCWKAPKANTVIIDGEDSVLRAVDGKTIFRKEFSEGHECLSEQDAKSRGFASSLDAFQALHIPRLRQYYPPTIELSDQLTAAIMESLDGKLDIQFVRPKENKPAKTIDVYQDIQLRPALFSEKSSPGELTALNEDYLCFTPSISRRANPPWLESVIAKVRSWNWPTMTRLIGVLEENSGDELFFFNPDDPAGTLQIFREPISENEAIHLLSSDGKSLLTWSMQETRAAKEAEHGLVRIYPFPLRTNWQWRLVVAVAIPAVFWIALIRARRRVARPLQPLIIMS